jgi:hypothetical protein
VGVAVDVSIRYRASLARRRHSRLASQLLSDITHFPLSPLRQHFLRACDFVIVVGGHLLAPVNGRKLLQFSDSVSRLCDPQMAQIDSVFWDGRVGSRAVQKIMGSFRCSQ